MLSVIFRGSAKTLILVAGLTISSGCQGPSSSWNSNEPFKTQIVDTRSSGTQFRVVELKGVKDQKTLNGEVVEFYYAPGENGNRVKGEAPIARFIENSSGVFIPADVLSLQMVTMYYHLQELKKLEFSIKEEGLVSWPRKVGLRVRTENAMTRFDNAFYSGQTDMLYFVPYKSDETPIPLNPGVLAHELFHSYFAHIVVDYVYGVKYLEKNRDVNMMDQEALVSSLALDYYVKSINEGLADFWGWLYSDDPDFVALSLPKALEDRGLNQSSFGRRLLNDEGVRFSARVFSTLECDGAEQRRSPYDCSSVEGYRNGSLLARTFKAMAQSRQARLKLSKSELKQDLAKKTFDLLVKVRGNLKKENLSLDQVVLDWAKSFGSLSQDECNIIQASLSAIRAGSGLCAGK